MADDPFNLQRFVDAQANGIYKQALREIRAGEKRGHWMWFIFPQSAELGRSRTAKFYGLSGEEEARAHLAHSLLGPRYRESRGRSAGAGGCGQEPGGDLRRARRTKVQVFRGDLRGLSSSDHFGSLPCCGR